MPNNYTTNIFAYGFPPIGTNKAPLIVKILAKHHVETTTNLKIINGQINFISGKVWDSKRNDFDLGLGANITVQGLLSQEDIDEINKTKDDQLHIYSLTYHLSHNQTQNHIQNKNKSQHPNNKNLIKKHNKTLGNDEIRNYNDETTQTQYIPPSRSQKSHFKSNVLKDLNDKIQENIKYNKIINDKIITNTPTTILPNTPDNINNIDNKDEHSLETNKTSLTQNNKHRALLTAKAIPNDTIEIHPIKINSKTFTQNREYKQFQTEDKNGTISPQKTIPNNINNIKDKTASKSIQSIQTKSSLDGQKSNNNIDDMDENVNKNKNKISAIPSKTSNKQLLNNKSNKILSTPKEIYDNEDANNNINLNASSPKNISNKKPITYIITHSTTSPNANLANMRAISGTKWNNNHYTKHEVKYGTYSGTLISLLSILLSLLLSHICSRTTLYIFKMISYDTSNDALILCDIIISILWLYGSNEMIYNGLQSHIQIYNDETTNNNIKCDTLSPSKTIPNGNILYTLDTG